MLLICTLQNQISNPHQSCYLRLGKAIPESQISVFTGGTNPVFLHLSETVSKKLNFFYFRSLFLSGGTCNCPSSWISVTTAWSIMCRTWKLKEKKKNHIWNQLFSNRDLRKISNPVSLIFQPLQLSKVLRFLCPPCSLLPWWTWASCFCRAAFQMRMMARDQQRCL